MYKVGKHFQIKSLKGLTFIVWETIDCLLWFSDLKNISACKVQSTKFVKFLKIIKKTKQALAHEITDDAFHPYKITY